ncbi:hypothetical protein KAI78_09630 [bacterium]|nr:hypothetical protein [bacterium]
MKSKLPIIIVLMLFSATVFAETVIAVQDFQVNDVESSAAMICSDEFRNVLIGRPGLKILDRGLMAAVLEEQNLQLSGCSDAACAVKVGKILAANLMVIGSVSKLGTLYYLNIKGINVQSSEIVFSKSASVEGKIESLVKLAGSLSREIFDEHLRLLQPGGSAKKDAVKKSTKVKKEKPKKVKKSKEAKPEKVEKVKKVKKIKKEKPVKDSPETFKKFGIAVGTLSISAKYNISAKMQSELKFSFDDSSWLIGPKFTYSFFNFGPIAIQSGLEIGYLRFSIYGLEGAGYYVGAFLGAEYFFLGNASLSADIGAVFMDMKNTNMEAGFQESGVNGVFNTALSFYF